MTADNNYFFKPTAALIYDFELAVPVDLLLAQPFSLLDAGFGGYVEVFFNLALLATLRFMHQQEHQLLAKQGAQPCARLTAHACLSSPSKALIGRSLTTGPGDG